MSQTVYLAGRYSRRRELCNYRAELIALGFEVPARWLNGNHQITDDGTPITEDGTPIPSDGWRSPEHQRGIFAIEDFDDVATADLLIAFTEPSRSNNSRNVRHVELGIALGRGIPVFIVGPRENIFCWLPSVKQFDTWQQLVNTLRMVDTGRFRSFSTP